jgi:class 3 adenylate cyclase/tetratricopeptide (TPR) repeat protein
VQGVARELGGWHQPDRYVQLPVTPSDDEDLQQRLRPYSPDLLLGWPVGVPWQALDGSLVSADIAGFTALSERLAARGREGAEEVNALISDCFDGMIEDCAGRGGDVVKFGGDALLVWFTGDHHATRAVSAAIAMRSTVRRPRRTSDGRRVQLGISIGVNSGVHHVVHVHGVVPDVLITGPGATATVRAESDADAGMVLVTDSTAALLPASWLGPRHGSGVVVTRKTPAAPGPVPTASAWTARPFDLVPPEHRATVLGGITAEHRQLAVAFVAFGRADELVEAGRIDELAVRLQLLTDEITAANARNLTYLSATDVAVDGGKFIITGGAPIAHGDNEDRLLRTMRQVIDADPGLDLHGGVHRGFLYAGDLGSWRRRTYATLGDAINLSARLCAKAGVGEIVVSRTAMEWSSVEFEVEPLPPFHVKGKTQMIHAGLLGPFRGRRADQLTVNGTIIGRDAELARLERAVWAARDGESTALVVVGEPGIGRTLLLAEIAQRAVGAHRLVVRCSPLDRAHGHSAIADAIRGLLDVSPVHDGHDVLRRLADIGQEHFPTAIALLPLLAPLFGIEVPETEESTALPAAMRANRTAQLVAQVFTALVREHTVLLVDDVHHGDDTTQAALELLCATGLDIPLCTIATSTGAEVLPDVEVVELPPLGESDVAALVESLVGDAPISSEAERDLVARSGGNPMFATEMANALLGGSDGAPASLDAAIEIRFDRLDALDRRVLRTAAVIGRDVEIALLAALLEPDVLSDHNRWDRLAEFLERVGPGVVRFRFDAHLRVAYESLPFQVRRHLHARVCDLLLVREDAGRELAATMAHHAAASGDDQRTWALASRAAAVAADTGRFGEAAVLYRSAWRARRGAPPDEVLAVAERAGDTFEVVGDFESSAEVYSRAARLTPWPVDRARLLRKRGDVAERVGDYVAAQRLYVRAARELRAVPWSVAIREQAQLDCARSGFAMRQSRFDEAWRFANVAMAQAERIGDWTTAAHAALMVDNLISQIGRSGGTVTHPDVLGLYERAGDLLGAARWLSNRAVDHYYEGRWDDAVRMYRESATQCARFGHLVSEATALNNVAEIHSDRGEYDAARATFRAARRSWRAVGYGVGVALVQANLGRLATRTGAFEEADELLAESIERFAPLGMASMTADARLRRIENALLSGGSVPPTWWPGDDDVEDDVVVQIYAVRMRSLDAHLSGRREPAAESANEAIVRSRSAGLPFDLALSLRLRAAVVDRADQIASDDAEIADLHRRLGIVTPPAVVPGVASSVTSTVPLADGSVSLRSIRSQV